ncbi:hypothetical protein FOMPIDRAFT_1080053, partial [Fomitopsis schrenkii]
VKCHIAKLIEDPDLLLGPSATYETGSLDAIAWVRPDAILAIREMSPRLPALRPMLIAFLKGAAETWERFTEEFAAGGEISLATEDELDQAWMMSTNGANEGALGAYRLWARRNPHGTQAYFNAQKKHNDNDTAGFMEAMFDDLCHSHVRHEARNLDNSGHESLRHKLETEHDIAVAQQRASEAA